METQGEATSSGSRLIRPMARDMDFNIRFGAPQRTAVSGNSAVQPTGAPPGKPRSAFPILLFGELLMSLPTVTCLSAVEQTSVILSTVFVRPIPRMADRRQPSIRSQLLILAA